MEESLIEALGLVKSSKNRLKVLQEIYKREYLTPMEISKKTGIIINHVSNVLKDLSDNDLIICVNIEKKKGRLYKVTEKGKKIMAYLLDETT